MRGNLGVNTDKLEKQTYGHGQAGEVKIWGRRRSEAASIEASRFPRFASSSQSSLAGDTGMGPTDPSGGPCAASLMVPPTHI